MREPRQARATTANRVARGGRAWAFGFIRGWQSSATARFGGRAEARLTLSNLAERVGVTPATVHRWELAERKPSPSIYLALGVVGLQRDQEAWARTRARRRQRKPRSALRIEVILPSGMDVESAQARCTAALAELVTAQAANP